MKHKEDHALFNCLWWDTYHQTDLFTDPAPVWDYCTESVINHLNTAYFLPPHISFPQLGSG